MDFSSSFHSTVISGRWLRESVPLAPSIWTEQALGWTETFTPEGTGIDFLPMRDIVVSLVLRFGPMDHA
jgi:hypothetical protein